MLILGESLMSYPQCPRVASTGDRLPILTLASGCASLALGLLVLIGWQLHILVWVQLGPDLVPMQYNSALCLLFMGAAIMARQWDRAAWLAPVLGALAASIGGITLCQDLFQLNLGIDQLFFHAYVTTHTSHPGRMSPISAMGFLAIGLAMLALGRGITRRWRLLAAGALASLAVSIMVVTLLGYACGLHAAYAWGHLTDVSIQTASGLALVGAGVFNLAWKNGLAPGERTPRWLPIPLMLGVLTAAIAFYSALGSEQNENIAQTVKAGAESVKNQISVRIDARIRSIVRMAKRWDFEGGTPREVWENDATDYVHDFPDLQALEWIDASHHVRWIVPLAGNEAKLGLDLTRETHRKAAVDLAVKEQQPVMTPIVQLFRGGAGWIIYTPLLVKGRPDGLIAAVIKAQPCLDRFLPRVVAEGEALEFSDSGTVFYQRDASQPPINPAWINSEQVEMHGATWQIRIWPTPILTSQLYSPLPRVILIAGVLGSLLLGATCYFAQRSSRHASETARKNADLQEALEKVRTLEGLLPICCSCKRVRDDTGYWSQIDTYLGHHTNASLSHGYCPECAAKTFKEFGLDIPESVTTELEAGNFER
jgi:sensor domain CHASE-containing protein